MIVDIALVVALVFTNLFWMVYTINLLNSLPRAAGQTAIKLPVKLPALPFKKPVADPPHYTKTKPSELEDITDTSASIDDVLAATRKAALSG